MNKEITTKINQEIATKINMPAKNIILYGPPGTGKTFNSINKAVEIAAPDKYQSSNDEANQSSNDEANKANKKIFDEIRKNGQIEFVTFHQNYAYEDFMIGIKPNINEETEGLSFKRHNGIFYDIAKRAKENYFNSKKESTTLTKENWVKNVFKNFIEYIDEAIEKDGKFIIINDVSIYSTEEEAFNYIGVKSNGEKWILQFKMHYTSLILMFLANVQNRKDVKAMDNITGTEKQHATYCFQLIEKFRAYLKNNNKEFDETKTEIETEKLQNYVLIIDEVNRANISKVFGELITLLEDDKRLGEDNEIKITLPNGEKGFGVPPNLYIIGTMNTADKSIALIDIALRRRFEFIGYYPKSNLLREDKEAIILLDKINEAIFKEKKSADYLIGHAYFMKKQPIEVVLKNKVVPLLMEYFSGKTDIVSKIFEHTSWSVIYDTKFFTWNISPL